MQTASSAIADENNAMDCQPIPGRAYKTREPDVTFQSGEVGPKSGLLFGAEFHSMGGYIGPATRLPDGRVSNESESPWVLVAEETGT